MYEDICSTFTTSLELVIIPGLTRLDINTKYIFHLSMVVINLFFAIANEHYILDCSMCLYTIIILDS